MTSSPLLDGDEIRDLLVELGERLSARGLRARMFLVGGAALALAFNTRRATRDLDAVFEPKSEVYDEARRMAAERGLPDDWLNDGVKGLLPDRSDIVVGSHLDTPGLSVEVASAEYLFSMKAAAARDEVDADDLRFLARHLGLTDPREAIELVERFYSPHRLKPVSQYLVEDVLQQIAASAGEPDSPSPEGDTGPGGRGRVRPYRRGDGTPVRGHHRRRP